MPRLHHENGREMMLFCSCIVSSLACIAVFVPILPALAHDLWITRIGEGAAAPRDCSKLASISASVG
jgi:hypothetical protein